MFHFCRLLVGAPNEMNGPYKQGEFTSVPVARKQWKQLFQAEPRYSITTLTVVTHSVRGGEINKHLDIVIIRNTINNTSIIFHIAHHFKCPFICMHLFVVCVCHLCVSICVHLHVPVCDWLLNCLHFLLHPL